MLYDMRELAGVCCGTHDGRVGRHTSVLGQVGLFHSMEDHALSNHTYSHGRQLCEFWDCMPLS